MTATSNFLKLTGLGLAISAGSSSVYAQLWSNTFDEVKGYSLVIKNSVTFSGNAKVYEGLFVGGNLTAANGEFGSRLSNGALGLYVDGTYNPAGSKMLSAGGALSTYYVNNLTGSFVQGTGTTGGNDPVSRTTASIFSDFVARSEAFFTAGESQANLNVYGAVYAGAVTGDFNNFSISLTSGKLNVLNIDGASALTAWLEGNGNLSFTGFTEGTRLVINYEGTGAGDEFLVNAKIQGLAPALHGAVMFNLSNFGAGARFAASGAFQASVLAPDVDVTWAGNDLDGAIVGRSLNVTSSMQFHDSVTSFDLEPVPEPSTYGLFGAALLGGLAYLRRRGGRR